MAGKEKLQRAIAKTLGGYQEARTNMPAVLGNGAGIVSVPSRPDYVYVRINKDVVQVYNNRVPNVNDFPVLVGYDHLNPRLLQVLTQNIGTHFGMSDEPTWEGSDTHHKTHEWMNPEGGEDVVNVQLRQMMPLRVIGITGTSRVAVNRGFVPDLEEGWSRVPFQYVDFGDLDLIPTGTLARYMLISAQPDGNLLITTGSITSKASLYLNNIPDQVYGTYPIAAVRLHGEQDEGIEEGLTDTDIVDLRWYPYIRQSGTVHVSYEDEYEGFVRSFSFGDGLYVEVTGTVANVGLLGTADTEGTPINTLGDMIYGDYGDVQGDNVACWLPTGTSTVVVSSTMPPAWPNNPPEGGQGYHVQWANCDVATDQWKYYGWAADARNADCYDEWLYVDLGTPKEIYSAYYAQLPIGLGSGKAQSTIYKFKIWKSNNAVDWDEIVEVEINGARSITHEFAIPQTARYFKFAPTLMFSDPVWYGAEDWVVYSIYLYEVQSEIVETRIGIGDPGQFLGVTGGVPTWQDCEGGDITTDDAWEALGDLIVGTGDDTADILTVGDDGQMLYADSGEVTGLLWGDAPEGGGDNTLLIYDDSVFRVTGTAISFDDNLDVVVSGSVAYVNYTGSAIAPVTKYMSIPAGAFRLGASAPGRGTEGTFATLLFADNVTEEAYYNLHIPADWVEGTNLELAAYWTPTSVGTGTVAWEFDWQAVAIDEVLGASSAHVDIHDAVEEVDNELLETSYGIISGTAIAVDDTIGIRFYRDHDDVEDNYSGDAALIHLEVEYTSDGSGAGGVWEHTHEDDSEGGQLDWDSVWSDAEHDHSAVGEGGTFDADNLTSTGASDGEVLTSDGAGAAAWEASPSGLYEAYMMCSDVKATTTEGGTFTQDAWRTRVINTEDADTGNNMSIDSNQITLDTGTYRCSIIAPAFDVQRHQAQLYNITDAAVELVGTSIMTDPNFSGHSPSFIVGRFTIAAQKTFEIQHYCQQTKADTGFGVASDFGNNEIYTVAEFWKES